MKGIRDYSAYDIKVGDIFHIDECFYLITEYIPETHHNLKKTYRNYIVRAYDDYDFSFIKEGFLGDAEILNREKVVFESDEEEAKIRLLLL